MRIAIAHWSRRELGGAETYLRSILPDLRAAGHELALFSEDDQPWDREPIPLPSGSPEWCIARDGREAAFRKLREWRPDLLFVHLLRQPSVEAEVQTIGPAVLFAHGYHGTCISGTKMCKRPTPRPCTEPFGWRCLLHYYPRRCGGLNPVTMLRDYEKNRRRHDLLPRYRAVVTNSSHMRREYITNGCAAERVHVLGMPVASAASPAPAERSTGWRADEWHLVFGGRMDFLKGGRTLLAALPAAAAELGRRLRVTFAGDGPDRPQWERLAAAEVARAGGLLRIDFVGWKSGEELDRLWSEADLLVVPSLWPEPFGLVGPEAGLRGVPAAAFAVGGIPDWLIEGVNGHLAPGDPPSARGLTDAIVRCLRDPEGYASLRRGAREVALRFDREDHVDSLLQLFRELVPETTLHPLADEPMSSCSLTH